MIPTPVAETVERTRLDPEPVSRRDFLGLAALWSAAAAMFFATLGLLKLVKPGVLPTPSTKFKVVLPESIAPGAPFVTPGRPVVIVRDAEGVYAVSRVCTHLGCIVQPSPSGFECPCHGSKFAADGTVLRGPAPKPLAWLAISSLGGAAFIVDEGSPVPAGTKVKV